MDLISDFQNGLLRRSQSVAGEGAAARQLAVNIGLFFRHPGALLIPEIVKTFLHDPLHVIEVGTVVAAHALFLAIPPCLQASLS